MTNFIFVVLLVITFFSSCRNIIFHSEKSDKYNYLNVEAIDLIPKDNEIEDWVAKDDVEYYFKNDLFDYIDGAAEVYIKNNFEKLIIQEYVSDNFSGPIIVEIYQMQSQEWSSKVFSIEHIYNEKFIDIGEEGQFSNNYLMFWKSRFFVKVYCLCKETVIKKNIIDFGNIISEKIQ